MSNTLPNHPCTPKDAYDVVQRRRETILEAFENDNEFIKELTQNYDRDVKRDLDTPAQVIPELLQNADDVEECSSVTVKITDDELVMENDGRPLLVNEFEALTHIGQSTKQEPGYIGHFGRGFKTVFSVTDNPQISSGHFRFQFNRERCVLPEHLTDTDELETVDYIDGTRIRLPLKELTEHDRAQLEKHIDSLHRLMPYLRHVSKITVDVHGTETVYCRERESGDQFEEVVISKDGSVYERRHTFSTKKVLPEAELSELVEHRDLRNEEAFRDNPVPVKISFPVDEEGEPVSRDEPSRLFNFFPTQEEIDIPFDIQADFLLDSDRERLHDPESPYNRWVFEQVSAAYEIALDRYLDDESPSTAHLDIVPTRTDLDAYLERVQEDIVDVLRQRNCIPTNDGRWSEPGEVVVPEDGLEDHFSEAEVAEFRGQLSKLPAETLTTSLLDSLVRLSLLESFSVDDLIHSAGGGEVYQNKTRVELLRLVSLFNQLWTDTYQRKPNWDGDRKAFIKTAKAIPLIPLQSDKVVSANDRSNKLAIPPKRNADQYEIFLDRLALVDLRQPSESAYEDDDTNWSDTIQACRQFFTEVLELSTVEDEYVVSEIIANAFRNTEAESDATLDSYLKFIVRKSKRRKLATEGGWVKLRTKSAGAESVYRDPSELFFPDEYDLGYSLETILQSVESVEYVTPTYLDVYDKPSRWRSFLSNLGVEKRLAVSEQAPCARKKYSGREKVVTKLRDNGDTSTEVEYAPAKSGTKRDTWLNNSKYALSDYEPDGKLITVMETISQNGAQSEFVARELAKMFDKHWSLYEDCVYQTLYYANHKRKPYKANSVQTRCLSSFGTLLQKSAWCPTKSGGLQPPSSLFVESIKTEELEDEQFIADDLPFTEEIYAWLNVKTELGPEAIVDTLELAPTLWRDTAPSTIRRKVSAHLDQLRSRIDELPEGEVEELLSRVRNAEFVYIESAETQFRTPKQVVLGGFNLGDSLVSISTLYQQHHSFFAEHLDVRKRATIHDCLDYVELDEGQELIEEQQKAWGRAVQLLARMVDDLQEEESLDTELIQRLGSEQVIPTVGGTKARLTQLEYFCLSEQVLNRISLRFLLNRTVQPPSSENLSQQQLASLWKELKLKNLETDIGLDLVNGHSNPSSERDSLAADTRVQTLLTVCWSFLCSEGVEDEYASVLREIQGYSLREHDQLRGRYVRNGDYVSGDFSLCSYLDQESQTLHKTEGIDSYYDVARDIVGPLELTVDQVNQLHSLLSAAVCTEPELLETFLTNHDIAYSPFAAEVVDEETQETEEDEATELTEGDTSRTTEEESAVGSDPQPKSQTEEDTDEQSTEATGTVHTEDTPPTSPDESYEDSPATANEETTAAPDNRSSEGVDDPSQNGEQTKRRLKKEDMPSHWGKPSSHSTDSSKESQAESGERADRGSAKDHNNATSNTQVDPSQISFGSEMENRKEYSSRKEEPVVGGGTQYSSNSDPNSHGGGGGGEQANQSGRYGEEFVLTRIVEILRREGSSPKVVWHWRPKEIDAPKNIPDSDVWHPDSELPLTGYDQTAPGVEVTISGKQVRVLHIRDLSLGADILVEGMSFHPNQSVEYIIDPLELASDARAWLEVKSSQDIQSQFMLTPLEYGRAREQQENYHIIPVNNNQTHEVFTDPPLSDIGKLDEAGQIWIRGDNLTVRYR